jgi:serine/threonine protein phosphatase PrpC
MMPTCPEQIGSYFVFAISSGLPGHAFGDIASRTTIETLKASVKDTAGSAIDVLSTANWNADAELHGLSQTSREYAGFCNKTCCVHYRRKDEVFGPLCRGRQLLCHHKNTIETERNTATARHLSGSQILSP